MRLILAAVVGMALLLALVIRVQLHAFVALLVSSLTVGAIAGMPFADILTSATKGMGGTLGAIAVVVGLGAMFGQMLEVSGGARVLASALVGRFGEDKAQWSLGLTGFLVAIPVFFDVGFIILVPLVYGLAKRTGRSLVYYGIPLLVGLAATHAFIPPTPGPIAVAGLLHADLGWVILFGAVVGLPSAVIAGPVFARYIAPKVPASIPEYMAPPEGIEDGESRPLPSIGLIGTLIGVPLALIIVHTVAASVLPEESTLGAALVFIGHPMVALLITTILCFWLLGTRRGYTPKEVQSIATKALEPAGIIILVTGAGGVLKQVLVDSGVGKMLADHLLSAGMPPILLAFATAALVRVMQGSATVAMLTAAGLVSSLLGDIELSEPMLGLMVIAIAAGATTASHVNDSGFWLVNRYLGLSVADTMKTWTAATTLIALVGLVMTLALSVVV